MCHFVFVLNPGIDGRTDLESQHGGGRCDFTLAPVHTIHYRTLM